MKHLVMLCWAMAAMTMAIGCAPKQPPIAPLSANLAVKQVCIEKNQAVEIADFLPVVEDGFARHGIATRVYFGERPKNCPYTVKYVAYRGWDLALYMRLAYVTMFKDDKKVAGLGYILDGPFSKFGSVQSKIAPRMDEMLAEYPRYR